MEIKKQVSEQRKAEFSRAEYKDTIAKKFLTLNLAYSKWYCSKLFLEMSINTKGRPPVGLKDVSIKYEEFVRRFIDVWLLIKNQLKTVRVMEKEDFDNKIRELIRDDVPTQRVSDIYNTLNLWVSKLIPLEEIAYWQGRYNEED